MTSMKDPVSPQKPKLLDRVRLTMRAIMTAATSGAGGWVPVRRLPAARCLAQAGAGHGTGRQELLGHSDVSTTMIYTHVLNRGPAAVRSPADRLLGTAQPPGEIGCKGSQHIPARPKASPARPGPLPTRGYPQEARRGAGK